MKKLIALIACISVFACMSVSALAGAPAGSVEDISYTEATESASGYFTIDASDVATGNTQTTIVVIDGVKTTDENGVEKYNISTDTIQYINQQDTASFTVIPKDHDTYLESATEKTLTVLIGGDNINRTELGTITYAAAEVQKFTVTFYDEDGTTKLQEVEYESGAALTAPANPTKAEDENYTYAFAGWAVKGTTDVISLPATVTEAAEYVAVYTATPKEVGGGEAVTISYQLVNVDITSSTVDSAVGTATLNSGDVIYTSMTEPTLSGYEFIGWYTDSTLATKLDKSATATANTTIYAKMAKTYLVGDVNGGRRPATNGADVQLIEDWMRDNTTSATIGTAKYPGTDTLIGDVNGGRRPATNGADVQLIEDWMRDNTTSTTIGTTNVPVVKD